MFNYDLLLSVYAQGIETSKASRYLVQVKDELSTEVVSL